MATIPGKRTSYRTGPITIYKPTHRGTPEPLPSQGPSFTPSPSISSISPPVAIRTRDTNESRLDQLVARIESIILSDSHDYSQTFIPVETVDLFERCKERLLTHPNPTVAEEFDTKLFYEYDAKLGQMIITYETHQHERISRILLCVAKAVEQSASVPSDWAERLVDDNSPTITLEHNGYSGDFKPDGGLSYDDRTTAIPVLIVEVAHSQTEKDLLRAGRRWLKGSGGLVRTVILLKLNYPAPVTNIRIWVLRLRTTGDKLKIRHWGPKVLWDATGQIPEPGLSLELDLEDIFGEYVESLPPGDPRRSSTVSIPFTDLQSWCEKKLKFQQESKIPAMEAMKNNMKSILGKRFHDDSPELSEECEGCITTISEEPKEDQDGSFKGDCWKLGNTKGKPSSDRVEESKRAKTG